MTDGETQKKVSELLSSHVDRMFDSALEGVDPSDSEAVVIAIRTHAVLQQRMHRELIALLEAQGEAE